VQREEARGTEVLGVGVGLDLSPYYRRSLVLDLGGRLTNAVFAELVQLMRPRGR
jgi:cobaltochelatase CobT